MGMFDAFVFGAAAPALVALVCRLSLLHFRTHSTSILLMHAAFAVAVVWAGHDAYIGAATIGDAAAVAGVLSWVSISYETWRNGVPAHFTKPAPLEPLHWPAVSGGTGDK